MLVTFPSPYPGAPARPFTPKVLPARERAPTSYSSIVFIFDLYLSLSRSLGARQGVCRSRIKNEKGVEKRRGRLCEGMVG
jgi:hypothetical protein